MACQMRSASFGLAVVVLDVLLDQLAAVGAERGIQELHRCTRAMSFGLRDWRIVSKARMTCCWRPMTSSAGNWRSHTATDFADASGSAISFAPDVKKPNMIPRSLIFATRAVRLRTLVEHAVEGGRRNRHL